MNLSDALSLVRDRHSVARDRGLYFQTVEDQPIGSRELIIEGKRCVWFGSCGYLGLEHDPRVIQGAVEAAQRYGTQFSSSRGYFSAPLYAELESSLDRIFDAHVLAMPNTTLAHLAALPVLAAERDCIVLDHQCHASIHNAARFAQTRGTAVELVRHDGLDQALDRLRVLSRKHRQVWVCSDGVFSMFGDLAPVGMMKRWLDVADNIYLYVDDAHGMSWAGEHGRGSFLDRMPQTERIVVATTFAKAAGVGGAALVFPTPEMKDLVQLTGGPVVFTGPLQPPMQGALLASLRIHLTPEIDVHQAELASRVDLFNTLAEQAGLPLIVVNESPIFFVRMGDHNVAQEVARRALDDGFAINVSMFPTVPQRRSGLRVAVNAIHREADIQRLVDSLARHVPQVLTEAGVTPDALDDLFEGAVPEESAGRLIASDVGSARLAAAMTSPTPTSRADRLEVVRWDSITQIPREVWDPRMGATGCMSWAAMRTLEQAMGSGDPARPEHAWSFRYVGVRDGDSGHWLAMTSFNQALQKDDIFMHADLSEELERLRTDDPYLLTSRFIGSGSFFSEGSHLWLDRTAEWAPALARLVEEGIAWWQESEAAYLMLRDVDEADTEVAAVLDQLGLIPVPLPTSFTLDVPFSSVDEWLASRSKRSRRLLRQVVEQGAHYELRAWGGPNGPHMDPITMAHCYALYENLARQNRRINNFLVPAALLRGLLDSPAWQIHTLHRAVDGPPDGEAVAWWAFHRYADHDMPLICGVDPRYTRGEDSAYRQLLVQIVRLAIEDGQRVVHLGMDAAVEKKRLGARWAKKVAWTLKRGDHHTAELEAVIAQMQTQPLAQASK